jgi:hypothetical protein
MYLVYHRSNGLESFRAECGVIGSAVGDCSCKSSRKTHFPAEKCVNSHLQANGSYRFKGQCRITVMIDTS